MPRDHIFRWDLDKTYLQTDIERFRGLVKAFFEPASAKVAYPGAAPVLRAVARRPTNHLYILSGSPRQMARVLQEKLTIDGVAPRGMTLKPNLKNLLKGRFGALREQLGYKLPALLETRADGPEAAGETLVGDDVEIDPLIYSLYADLVARKVGPELLEEILGEAGTPASVRERATRDLERIPSGPRVERILIHLSGGTPPGLLDGYGPRLVAARDYLQVALVLFADGRIGPYAVTECLREVATLDRSKTLESTRELLARGSVTARAVAAWLESIDDPSDPLLDGFAVEIAPFASSATSGSPGPALGVPDYLALYREYRATRPSRATRPRS